VADARLFRKADHATIISTVGADLCRRSAYAVHQWLFKKFSYGGLKLSV